jgi:regulator of Ty1 transposition protein 109
MAGVDDASRMSVLNDRLAQALPKGAKFQIFHISTPPSKTEAIYFAPPNTSPDRTYCESHFVTVSIKSGQTGGDHEEDYVLIFAIEILIYSTAYSSTFFVSKADSTGYAHLLHLPKGGTSPLRTVSSTLLEYLVEKRSRPGIPCIISLFARAQDQYLFPGSIENSGKHVLDDRGLVRWWCRVIDPLISNHVEKPGDEWTKVHGYLVVPGSDSPISYVPQMARQQWTVGDPLREISRHSKDVPPRCLIPHFPDDPKARFLDELDDELMIGNAESFNGQWKSVKTLAQFWEAMEFRQECSAGRLVGFIWVVFSPKHVLDSQHIIGSQESMATDASDFQYIASPHELRVDDAQALRKPILPGTATSFRNRKLTGTVIPRMPRVKTHNTRDSFKRPETTPYYVWPVEGRGQVVLDQKDYKRATELLLRLDFANLDISRGSTKRWVDEVRMGASSKEASQFGAMVVGQKVEEVRSTGATVGAQTLSMGLVRKKRKPETSVEESAPSTAVPQVNILGSGTIRKKPKA